MFNNREIATAAWVLLFAVWALSQPGVRKAAWEVVYAFLRLPIPIYLVLFMAYMAGVVTLLAMAGFWHGGLIKDTVLWVCFSGFALGFKFLTANADKENIFRRIFLDNVRVMILIQFLVNTYTLPLVGELVWIPFVTLTAMLDAVARSNDKYASVARLTSPLLSVLGVTIVTFAVSNAVIDYQKLGNLDTLRRVVFPPLLSVMSSPFVYAVVLYSTYNLVFVRLKLGPEKTIEVMRHVKRRVILHCGVSVKKLRRLLNYHSLDLMRVQSVDDIDNILASDAAL